MFNGLTFLVYNRVGVHSCRRIGLVPALAIVASAQCLGGKAESDRDKTVARSMEHTRIQGLGALSVCCNLNLSTLSR